MSNARDEEMKKDRLNSFRFSFLGVSESLEGSDLANREVIGDCVSARGV